MNRDWDVRRRHSDLDRVNHDGNVVITVSPPTLLLSRNALTAVRLATAAGLRPRACPVVIDHRHGRVGAAPDVAAAAARLIPATAADLIAQLCRATGAPTGSVRVGTVSAASGHPQGRRVHSDAARWRADPGPGYSSVGHDGESFDREGVGRTGECRTCGRSLSPPGLPVARGMAGHAYGLKSRRVCAELAIRG